MTQKVEIIKIAPTESGAIFYPPGWLTSTQETLELRYSSRIYKPKFKAMKTVMFVLFVLALGLNLKAGAQTASDTSQIVPDTTNILSNQTISHFYPNPFTDQLTIDFPKETCGEIEVSVKIYDLFSGKCVFDGRFLNRIDIETCDWGSGLFAGFISHERGTEPFKVLHRR